MSLGFLMRCMSCALMNGAGQTSFKNKISVSWRWEFNKMPIIYGGGGPVAFFINQKRLFMDKKVLINYLVLRPARWLSCLSIGLADGKSWVRTLTGQTLRLFE